MSSVLVKGLKRTTCAVLCYGMVFSYPSWTIFGRVAHAAGEDSGNKTGAIDGSPDTDLAIPAPGTTASKPKGDTPPKKKHDEDGSASKTGGDPKKKGSEPPVGASCGDDKFFIGATSSGSMNLFTGDSVCTAGVGDPMSKPNCWTQFFVFLGAAEANSYYINNSPERSPAPGVAARTLSTVNDFVPKVGEELSKSGNEAALTKILDNMSRPDLIKNQDNKQCCMQLVDQARKVAGFIKSSTTNPANKDLKPNSSKQKKMDELIAQKQALCESGSGAVVAPVPGHTAPPQKEEKKKNGMLMAVLIALGVGLLIWALTKKKKKKKKDRPSETPKPCKGKKCGGGGSSGGSGGSDTGKPPCSTGNCGNNVGTTTAEEPPVTNGGNTYPSTNGDTTRGNSTGDNGGDTYPSTNGDTTRGNSTGDTGTVTGSTTATSGGDNTSTTNNGSTTLDDPVSGGDGPGRTTSGTPRPLAPNRTLVK